MESKDVSAVLQTMAPADDGTQLFVKKIGELLETGSYDKWADTYEQDSLNIHYRAPEVTAALAVELHPEGTYLDVGCGTGLCGAALKTRSPGLAIDACEPCAGMVARAQATGHYRTFMQCLAQDMPAAAEGAYDCVVASGVFMETGAGAMGPGSGAVAHCIRALKPGGHMVFSVSARSWARDDYDAAFEKLPVVVVKKQVGAYHDLVPEAHYIVLQKTA